MHIHMQVLAEHLSAATHATIVGSRSWGGIIGMGETELVDGTTIAHPSATMTSARGKMIEGRGAEPTRHVPMAPHDAIRGRDVQLEAAANLAVELAEAERARRTAQEDASRSGRRADGEWMSLPRRHAHWSKRTALQQQREADMEAEGASTDEEGSGRAD